MKGPILINSVMTDGEAIQFGQQLLTVLKDAGFSPTDVPFGERLMGLNPGAWIKDRDKQPKHAGPIFEAFKRAGVILTGQEQPDSVPDTETVEIAIGTHP